MRYKQLHDLIKLLNPKSICEIGTWNGQNAINMLNSCDADLYIGYDLFEEATAETDAVEFNVKAHNAVDTVRNRIKEAHGSVSVNLVKGNTRETLKNVRADFVFLDGGHSIETIESDYNAVKGSGVIVFDDYYVADEEGRCPDIYKVGCNKLLSNIPHIVFGDKDPVSGGGYTRLAMVICNG